MAGLEWWQRGVFYQIYPRSYADSNGDGIGDLPGMTSQLDYLADLGIDALWLSPFFSSPQHDCGYDVSDYTDVAPEYGTMADLRTFLDQAHARNIRVIFDLVLNHTSHEHPWFRESRSSLDNPKRDWYIWRDGQAEGPPNRWMSCFGGPAWEYDGTTGQYYYHYFLKQQPDLNWRNPQVRQEMYRVVRFWLDYGVDGFRLDAPGTLFEDKDFRDPTETRSQVELFLALRNASSAEEFQRASQDLERLYERQVEQPEVHEVMRELRQLVDTYDDRVLVGEVDDLAYHGDGSNELHLVFNFPLLRTERLGPAHVRANQRDRLARLPPGAWPCNTLGNHDTSRLRSHFGDGEHDAELTRLAAALTLTLRGTPFLYYGEEIGMSDLLLTDLTQVRDEFSKRLYELETTLVGSPPAVALRHAVEHGRDKCRTPMQWNALPRAGFSPPDVQTWLPIHPSFAHGVSVEEQRGTKGSLLEFYRSLLQLRRRSPALLGGSWSLVDADSADVLAFVRTAPEQTMLVILNWSRHSQSVDVASRLGRPQGCSDSASLAPDSALCARVRLSTHHAVAESLDLRRVDVAPYEVLIAELERSGGS
ncbi:MAG TPA: alpha-glucosidase [Anaerolineae bacterium]|nr:alpha-glucosidase [Anaerolineae bacterium]